MRQLVYLSVFILFSLILAWFVRNYYGISVILLIPFALFVYLAVVSKGAFSRVWTTAATVALCLSLFEFALFIAERSAEPKGSKTGTYSASGNWTRAPWGGMRAKGVYTAAREDTEGRAIYSVSYTIGDDGFRVTPQDPDREGLAYFLGGSFTFGVGLEDNQTLPYYFAKFAGEPAVKNLGIQGYGMHQAVKILDLRPPEKIDLVIVHTIP